MKKALCLLLLAACLLGGCAPSPDVTPAAPINALPSTAPANAAAPGATAPPAGAAGGEAPGVPAPTATLLPAAQAPDDVPVPTAVAPKQPRRVVLVSFDGARSDLVAGWMADGALPTFAAFAAQGLRSEYAQSIDPSLTAAAHNSLSTGAYPAQTGLVSNSFHNPSDSFYWYRRGFDELIDDGEPVWVTASKAGFTSAAVFFPGGSPTLPGQMADYTIGYGVQDAYSRQVKVALQPAGPEWQGELPASFSPLLEGEFNIAEVARVFVLLADSLDDGAPAYDTLLIDVDQQIDAHNARLALGEWAPLVLLPLKMAGAEFLFQGLDSHARPGKLSLFYSGVYHNTAAPRELLDALNERFGAFPSGVDSYALEHGWISPEDNLHLIERQANWMAAVAAWVYHDYEPDLLLTWQDGFDAGGHAFLLVDPRQPGYSAERAAEYAGYLQQAAQSADAALSTLLQAIDLRETSVILAADHGMSPIHTTVYVNTVLQQAGLLVLDSKDYVVVKETRAFAVASGGAVHVYVNLAGREKDGWVLPAEYDQVQAQVVELLSGLVDPATGEPVFSRVLTRDRLAEIHLDHPNAGDVFAQAVPGYHLDGWRGNPEVFEAPLFCAQHGYDSAGADMHAIFMAAGAGILPSGEAIPPVHIVDIAPTIASMLGFAPPEPNSGQPIPALAAP